MKFTNRIVLFSWSAFSNSTEVQALCDCKMGLWPMQNCYFKPQTIEVFSWWFLYEKCIILAKVFLFFKVHHSCIYVIPRSREVGQSYCWSVLTTIKACLYAIPQAIWINPDLLLVNGPGTCLPLCIAAVLVRESCKACMYALWIKS